MKTTTDKATPRPWSIEPHKVYDKSIGIRNVTFPSIVRVDNDDMPTGAGKANAALIVKAVNEYDALCVVAEAAFNAKENSYGQTEHDILCDALDALAQIRNQQGDS